MTISLAIPTYNSSQYLWECIKPAISHDFIGEIIIHDDGSTDSEYGNICEIASQINTSKIKVYRNKPNQKAFINKYLTVSKCSFDWVYLFDSDNWFDESIIEILETLDYSKEDTCYIESKLLVTDGNVVEYDYNDRIFDINKAKEYILNGVHHFDWFLNNGNFIVNRKKYLSSQQKFFEERLYHGSIDVLLFSYYWFLENNKYEIVDSLYHHHRVRPGNYFMENAEENMRLVQEYYNKILNL
jgi:glycosyltransferase involved in cell wall biosynthesis